MKKWKITAKKNHKLTVFETSQSLYTWIINDESDIVKLNSSKYNHVTKDIFLKKDDELLVEWIGSEYSYDQKCDITHTLKYIKLTLSYSLTDSWYEKYIETYEGWISDDILNLSEIKQRKLKRHPLIIEKIDNEIEKEFMSNSNISMSELYSSFEDSSNKDVQHSNITF